jgi:predicted neuraminidase
MGHWYIKQRPAWSAFEVPTILQEVIIEAKASRRTSEMMKSVLLPTTGAAKTHAASLVLLNNGNVMAFWFEGSREGAKDVVIKSAIFNTKTQTWNEPKTVIDRDTTQQNLLRYISRLGNPVPARTKTGQLHLYFVTSLSGWSTSSITTIVSEDEGETWSRPRRIITSPLLNYSTLVKSPAITFTDGSIGLPVYHELFGKFGELLRLGSIADSKQLVEKRRISSGRTTLQPVIFIESAKSAIACFRQAPIRRSDPKYISTSYTNDVGQIWQAGEYLPFNNPNAAIAGLTLSNGNRILVVNDLEKGRYRLVLLMSCMQFIDENLKYSAWKIVKVLEDDSKLPFENRRRFSYPYLITDKAEDVHLVYSFGENRIKHTRFNGAYFNNMCD